MFTIPRANVYQSSSGFSIEILGQTGLIYRESGRKMFVDSEVLAGPSGMLVYRDTIDRWEPPHDNELISDLERERILRNIQEAFLFQGFEIEVF